MTQADPPPSAEHTTANAWQLYQVTMEWVRHAETKTAALLAANATLVAALLALDKVSNLNMVWAGITLAAALISFGFAAWAMVPNLGAKGGDSLVFFDHAARNHTSKATYVTAHENLLSSHVPLVEDLAGQTWNLARAARKKFHWAGFSIFFFLLAGCSGGLLASWEVVSK